ncbi:putative membrane protein [Vibrio mimicus]|nr:putative membrane protein [Vibrio mimicus]
MTWTIETLGYVIGGGFICWLSGLGAGVILRYFRNIVISAISQ